MQVCPSCQAVFEADVERCLLDGTPLVAAPRAASAPEQLSNDSLVDDYRIEGLLGAGAFGQVYRACHRTSADAVAIKVLAAEHCAQAETVSRFFSEALAVDRIAHPNIIQIRSTGRLADDRPYYVMELLEGGTLSAYLSQRGPLPLAVAIPLLEAIASGLDAAHAAGIAHRDLKPDNIFLVGAGEGHPPRPKLLDFGVAKLLDGSAAHRTRTGTQLGTPAYMAPEQWRGKGVDHRADLFALGVLVYEILTGQRPFDGASAAVVMVKTLTGRPPAMSQLHPGLPAALDEPARRLLDKTPSLRPASASAAIAALAAAAE